MTLSLFKFDHFTATLILCETKFMANSNVPKILILTILKVLNFDFSKFEHHSSPKFTKNSKFRVSKNAKNDIFGLYDFTKIEFHVKSEWR